MMQNKTEELESDRPSRTTSHHCPVCNYSLVDIGPKCPECGSPLRLAVVSPFAFAGYGMAVALSLALAIHGLVATYEDGATFYYIAVGFVDDLNAIDGAPHSRWAVLREIIPLWNWITITIQLAVALCSSGIAWMLILRRRQPFEEPQIRRVKISLYALTTLQIALWVSLSLIYLIW